MKKKQPTAFEQLIDHLIVQPMMDKIIKEVEENMKKPESEWVPIIDVIGKHANPVMEELNKGFNPEEYKTKRTTNNE